MANFVVYRRVSTDRQGESGLGLEGQEAAIKAFLRPGDRVVGRYLEVESGGNDERPELAKAIKKAKRTGSILLVSTLDRLSRDVGFIANLRKQMGDDYLRFADSPHASPLEINVKAVIAEEERRKISERTRAALQAAKQRGTKLGGWRGHAPIEGLHLIGSAAASQARTRKATQVAFSMATQIEDLREEGITSLNGLAEALNARGTPTPRGTGKWTATSIRRVLARLEAAGGDD